jgi:hypothetical protein
MVPGEGYMLKRNGKETITFKYNYYEPGSTFLSSNRRSAKRTAASKHPATMTMAATISGITPQAGDRLLAISNGEVCGQAECSSDEVLYMSIGGSKPSPIYFVLERDGEWIASTTELMQFQSNAVMGSPKEPTKIDFTVNNQTSEDGWYTIHGMKLTKKPHQNGVYLFNGKKIIVK